MVRAPLHVEIALPYYMDNPTPAFSSHAWPSTSWLAKSLGFSAILRVAVPLKEAKSLDFRAGFPVRRMAVQS